MPTNHQAKARAPFLVIPTIQNTIRAAIPLPAPYSSHHPVGRHPCGEAGTASRSLPFYCQNSKSA
jgi:hypothetical protein